MVQESHLLASGLGHLSVLSRLFASTPFTFLSGVRSAARLSSTPEALGGLWSALMNGLGGRLFEGLASSGLFPVSYTHLTLPTILLV